MLWLCNYHDSDWETPVFIVSAPTKAEAVKAARDYTGDNTTRTEAIPQDVPEGTILRFVTRR
jgi:hypothetical protein